MNLSVIIAYVVLLFEMIYIIFQGGENMTSEIIAAIIAGIVAIAVAVIGNVVTFLKGRHNEKNEHDNLEKGHAGLSKEHENLSKEHDSILEAQKEHTSYLEKVTKEQVGILNEKQTSIQTDLKKLSEESIRMSEIQKQVKERGIDPEKMVADIRHLVQMNADQSQQIRQLTEEKRTLSQEKDHLLSENISLKVQRDQLEIQLKEKEQMIRELQHPSKDEPDWDFGR
ncbi:hypothetical protein [Eubacterium sp. An3]|uniref:hypothetical protein n=1 Tax=Eubacterium sp. An3 TaxID=1965628 RepID=UPI000B37EF1B|nr:hypothetical protein [Eubacterium sp. An3]OUO24980.1 hypothetical protein B5F87_18630 [Eubacterium sp. An3]